MVLIKENSKMEPKDLIKKTYDQLKTEVYTEANKVLTNDLQKKNLEKFNEIKRNCDSMINTIVDTEKNCIDNHIKYLKDCDIKHNKDIERAIFSNSNQLIFAKIRSKDGYGFGVLIKIINGYISNNGLQLIKNELENFDPKSSLEDNVTGIFKLDMNNNGKAKLHSGLITNEILKIWFMLKKLYVTYLISNETKLDYQIDLEELYTLKDINLYCKYFEEIGPNAFNNNQVRLANFKKVSFLGNSIKKIDPCAFNTLHQLEVLNLDANKLEFIDINWFEPLFSLKVLHLSNNELKFIRPKTFEKLKNLEVLHLYGYSNCIKYEKNVFYGLENLKELFISGFHGIQPDIFENLENLTNLQLDYNHTNEIFKEELFLNLVNLENVLIQNCRFMKVEKKFLPMQTKLELLTIQDCPIKKISSKAFSHMKELNTIWLLGVGLNHIEKSTFKGLTKLRKIDLSYNKFEEGHIFGFDEIDESIIFNM